MFCHSYFIYITLTVRIFYDEILEIFFFAIQSPIASKIPNFPRQPTFILIKLFLETILYLRSDFCFRINESKILMKNGGAVDTEKNEIFPKRAIRIINNIYIKNILNDFFISTELTRTSTNKETHTHKYIYLKKN